MQVNPLLSAILREPWLIEPGAAESYYPLVQNILSGQFKAEGVEKDPALSYTAFSGDSMASSDTKPEGGSIMRLNLRGPMLKYGGMCSYGTMDYVNWVKDANSDDEIGGILFEVDSPGGQGSGVDLLREVIVLSEKPVYVQVNGQIASAAAYSLIGADKIYLSSKSDRIGSFGGMVTYKDYSEAMKRMGIKDVTIYAPQSTEKNYEAEEALKGNEKPLKAELKKLIDIQHSAVRELRDISTDKWETGRMFFAEEALAINLIDGIQSIDQTIEELLSLIQTNNNSSQMFNKHKKLSALAGVAEADLTETQLTDVNAELDSLQLSAVRVVPASFVADADNAIAEKNVALKAQKDAEAALTAMTAERDNWKVKAESFGSQPGEKPTQLEKKNETVEDPKEPVMISETDKELMELKGKVFQVVE